MMVIWTSSPVRGTAEAVLRYYERDYINDKLNNTFPIVTIGSPERTLKTSEAKALADGGNQVSVSQSIVTAFGTDYFYIQSQDYLMVYEFRELRMVSPSAEKWTYGECWV